MKPTKRTILILVLVAILLAVPATVLAGKLIYKARLITAQETVPVIGSNAKGSFIFGTDPEGKWVFKLKVRNLSGPVGGAHIHGPAMHGQAAADAAAGIQRAPHLAPLIDLALHTGMRLEEMLGLEWSRVDLQHHQIYLEGQHTKAGRRRTVPLNAVARAALLTRARFRAQYCPAAPWVFCNEAGERIGSVKRSFATACGKAASRTSVSTTSVIPAPPGWCRRGCRLRR